MSCTFIHSAPRLWSLETISQWKDPGLPGATFEDTAGVGNEHSESGTPYLPGKQGVCPRPLQGVQGIPEADLQGPSPPEMGQ